MISKFYQPERLRSFRRLPAFRSHQRFDRMDERKWGNLLCRLRGRITTGGYDETTKTGSITLAYSHFRRDGREVEYRGGYLHFPGCRLRD